MIANLPLLSKIIQELDAAGEDDWVRSPMRGSPGDLSTLEVSREPSGLIRFGVFDRMDGDRVCLFEGKARQNDEGAMVLEPEDLAVYESFIEASRSYSV